MLKITKKVEYALMALVYISQKKNDELSSAKEIAVKNSIPREILAKTLQELASLKMVKSYKGPKGGYKICTDINKINMIEFIELLEGPVGLTDCNISMLCQQEGCCQIKDPLSRINNKIINTLKNISLGEFTSKQEKK